MTTKLLYCLDEVDEETYPGYPGPLWNGWESPLFDRETLIRFAEKGIRRPIVFEGDVAILKMDVDDPETWRRHEPQIVNGETVYDMMDFCFNRAFYVETLKCQSSAFSVYGHPCCGGEVCGLFRTMGGELKPACSEHADPSLTKAEFPDPEGELFYVMGEHVGPYAAHEDAFKQKRFVHVYPTRRHAELAFEYYKPLARNDDAGFPMFVVSAMGDRPDEWSVSTENEEGVTL